MVEEIVCSRARTTNMDQTWMQRMSHAMFHLQTNFDCATATSNWHAGQSCSTTVRGPCPRTVHAMEHQYARKPLRDSNMNTTHATNTQNKQTIMPYSQNVQNYHTTKHDINAYTLNECQRLRNHHMAIWYIQSTSEAEI